MGAWDSGFKARMYNAKCDLDVWLTGHGVTVPADAKFDEMVGMLGRTVRPEYTGDDITVSGVTATAKNIGIAVDGNVFLFVLFNDISPTGTQTSISLNGLLIHTVSAPDGVTVVSNGLMFAYSYRYSSTTRYARRVYGVYYTVSGLTKKAAFNVAITKNTSNIASALTINYV